MDSHISELIKSRRFKEAHKALSKRLKKSPNDSALLISQAEIYLTSGNYAECKRTCINLCTRKPPITDYECLIALFDIICRLHLIATTFKVSEVSSLWSNAIQATTPSERQIDLAEEWASQCIKHEQWSLLAKAALTLQRQMPVDSDKRRQYWFWQITAYFLAGLENTAETTLSAASNTVLTSLVELDRKMAMSLLGKAVKDMPSEVRSEDIAQPGLWITKSAELQLLCLANLAFGSDMNIRDVLADRRLQKLFASNLDVLQFEKRLHARVGKRSIELWQWASHHLQHALDVRKFYLLENWDFWEALLQHPDNDCIGNQPLHTGIPSAMSATESSGTEQQSLFATLTASIQTMIDNARQHAGRNMRAPQLAELKFQWHNSQHAHLNRRPVQSDATPSKTGILSSYFDRNCTQGYVGDDLDGYVPQLSRSDFIKLRKRISHNESQTVSGRTSAEESQLHWLTREINSLKIDYVYIESQLVNDQQLPQRQKERLLELFICNCLRLYRTSLSHTATLPSTSPEPGDGACELAIRALMLLGVMISQSGYRNQALCLQTYVISQAKHNFEARLDHVIHSLFAGFPLSAWQAFQGLDVKKTLHEKISPFMFTRISTIQPFPSPQLNAYEVMQTILQFYQQASMDVPDYQELALKHENYAGVADMREFLRRLRYSPTRLMVIYESRRIARLTGISQQISEDLDGFEDVFAEVDRYKPMIPSQPSMACVSFGKDHLTWLILADAAISIVTCAENEQLDKMQQKSAALLLLRTMSSNLPALGHHRTFEQQVFSAYQCLVDVVSFLANASDSKASLHDLLEKLGTSIKTCFIEVAERAQVQEDSACFLPSANWYHENWVCLELCQATSKLSVKLLAYIKRKWPSEQSTCKPYISTTAIQRLTMEHSKIVKERARAIEMRIDKAQERNHLVEKLLGPATDGLSAMMDLIGHESVEDIVAGFVASTRLALNGIDQFQLR